MRWKQLIPFLRQEMINGSTATTVGSSTIYLPTSNYNMLPQISPTPTPATTPAISEPNTRRSARSEPAKWPDSTTGPALGSRASAVNSTTDASANGRYVNLARWNSHYMIPKSNTGASGSDPITTGFSDPNYWAPDWVFVTGNGSTVITQPTSAVIGRYAYAIYDEGGLLDMNAAGYPSGSSILQYGRKGSLAFADLTGLSTYGLSTVTIANVVGWRNYASAQVSGLGPPFSEP